MLYPAIKSPVFKMDVKIEKGSELSHSVTYVRKLCLTVKYLKQLSLLRRSLSSDLITVISYLKGKEGVILQNRTLSSYFFI